MITKLMDMKYTIIASLLFGLLAHPILSQVPSLLDRFWPVVEMQGELVSQTEREVVVHISGKKNRDCKFLQIDSYFKTDTGMLIDAGELRQDGTGLDSTTRPIGNFDLGLLVISPKPLVKTTDMLMYIEHDCNGRLVLNKIAEIKL